VPTYQYVCTACGEPLEVVQSFTDDALTQCPACQEGKLRKVFNSVGIVFKGSGFYRNDSRTTNGAETPKPVGDTTTPASSDGDSTSKPSDAKPSPETPAAPAPPTPTSPAPTNKSSGPASATK